MKMLLSLILLLSSSCVALAHEADLELDKTIAKQGEFFQAYVRGVKSKPRIWFNTLEYEMFEVEEERWFSIDPEKRKAEQQYKTFRALIPIENLTRTGKYSVLARLGDWSERIPVQINDNGKGVSHITLSDDKAGLTATAKELKTVGSGLRTRSYTKLWEGKFDYPSKANRSSPFGVKRSYNGGPITSYHKGLDFSASLGSPVYAPADGKVAATGKEVEGFVVHGNTVILDHGHALTSIYMHLNKIDVTEGQQVHKGDKIGEVGHTGISTGPHLHWGTYLYGTSVEPEIFVREEIL